MEAWFAPNFLALFMDLGVSGAHAQFRVDMARGQGHEVVRTQRAAPPVLTQSR